MTDSFGAFQHAISTFGDRLGDIRLAPLAIALALHLLSLLVRSGVWCGILRAAFPERRVSLRSSVWAYLAGVGANAIAPLRGGDVVRVYTIHRELGDVSIATIVSTLVAEAMFGGVVVVGIAAAAIGLGWLPPVVGLPDANAFEVSFLVRHALAAGVVLGAVLVVGGLTAEWAARHVIGFWRHITAGFRILRSPGHFARVVAAPQLVDWALRIGVAYFLLQAFGIHPAVRYAMLVVVIDSISTALPFTPGGAGAQQGLLVFALSGVAGSGEVLAFSVGAQAVMLAFNLLLGLIACFALFGHMRIRSLAPSV
jgi:uncharacterized membrane protein YbhN (UPF0104 family)